MKTRSLTLWRAQSLTVKKKSTRQKTWTKMRFSKLLKTTVRRRRKLARLPSKRMRKPTILQKFPRRKKRPAKTSEFLIHFAHYH